MRQLSIKVRPRTAKETLNLGMMVARRYFPALLRAVLPMWAVSVMLAGLTWWLIDSPNAPLWAIVVLWWLKPLYERPVLMRLSRLLFDLPLDARQEQKSAFARGWLAELTVLRLARGNAPIRHALHLLENVQGRHYRERRRFFAGMEGNFSALLLLMVLEIGWLMGVLWLLPGSVETDSNLLLILRENPDALGEAFHGLYVVMALLYMPLAAVTSVLYVSMGFMRYLNRRIISEGWAIALDLRALAARLPALCLALLLAFATLFSPPGHAIDAEQSAEDKAWVQAQVDDEKNGPYAMRKVRPEQADATLPNLRGADAFSEFVRIALLVLGVGIVLYLLLAISKHRQIWRKSATVADDAQADITRHGKQFHAQNSAAALQYWQAGQMVAALAVLYGRMVANPAAHQLPALLAGESESEYLQRARAQISAPQQQFLSDFFQLWQRIVYGHENLDRDHVFDIIQRYQALWRA